MDDLLRSAAERAIRYLDGVGGRRVAPSSADVERLAALDVPFPEDGCPPESVLATLDELGSPATVATAGGRYFGFVIGGSLPASVAASWMAAAWDQNAGMVTASPAAAAFEEVALRWVREALGAPAGCGAGVVTGATMANLCGLAAARHALLEREGWDAEARGLFGAPPLTVVVGDDVHVSVLRALGLLGLGSERVVRVPVDDQGRLRAAELPRLDARTIVCLQAGNVSTGAFDPFRPVCAAAREAGAWVHVDGAFGLWAAAVPRLAPLVDGLFEADSWSTDGHKWLNVPYDSGLALVREPRHLRAAMTWSAAYLVATGRREPSHYTPEMSRRARGVELWAALRSLGRAGLVGLVERTCAHARRFAEGLAAAGFQVWNEVVANQVLVSFGDDERTRRVVEALQADGTCWCGGTVWRGRAAMRISVSSWATTDEDVERSLAAMVRAAGG